MTFSLLPSPIQQRLFHDAHLLGLWLGFFAGMLLPIQEGRITWALFLMMLTIMQGVSLRLICKSAVIATLLSVPITLLNVLTQYTEHHLSVIQAITHPVTYQATLRVGLMTWVALIGHSLIHISDVINWANQRAYLPNTQAFALQIGFNALNHMRTICIQLLINAKQRRLRLHQYIMLWLPLLVCALRDAKQGAQALRARGMNQTHTQSFSRFNYQATCVQHKRFRWAVFFCFLSILSTELFFYGITK